MKKYGIFKILDGENNNFTAYVEYIPNPLSFLPDVFGDEFCILPHDIITGARILDGRYGSIEDQIRIGNDISDKLIYCKAICRDMSATRMNAILKSLTPADIERYNARVKEIQEIYSNKMEVFENYREVKRNKKYEEKQKELEEQAAIREARIKIRKLLEQNNNQN